MDKQHFSAPSGASIITQGDPLADLDADQPIPFALTDTALDVLAALAHDDRFTAVYSTYAPRIRTYILLRLRHLDHALADDLTQETFVRVLRDLHTVRAEDEHLFGWLATIARRVMCDHYRLHRNHRETVADTSGADWADCNLTPAASGAYAVVRNGVRAKAEVTR